MTTWPSGVYRVRSEAGGGPTHIAHLRRRAHDLVAGPRGDPPPPRRRAQAPARGEGASSSRTSPGNSSARNRRSAVSRTARACPAGATSGTCSRSTTSPTATSASGSWTGRATGQAKMWWQVVQRRPATRPWRRTSSSSGMRRASTRYEPHVVHGLLQTRDYARGVLRNALGSTACPSGRSSAWSRSGCSRQDALNAGARADSSAACSTSRRSPRRRIADVLKAQLEHLHRRSPRPSTSTSASCRSRAGLVPASRGVVRQAASSQRGHRARPRLRRAAAGRRASSSPTRRSRRS